MRLDPTDYAIISQALIAAAREMGTKLVRSAYSTILREARDGSAALLDKQGNVVAQAELIPMQLGAMGGIIAPCLTRFAPDTLKEDDLLITNDPYEGGQHLQDIFIFTPIFFGSALVGFSASVAHHLDIGGGSPGLNMSATDVFQEGIRLPPSKYSYSRDWNGGSLERLLAANTRTPDQTIGDLNAQFAANKVGAARLQQYCAKYGVEVVSAAMEELMNYSERRMRNAIAAVPDGIYFGEDAIDDDGSGSKPVYIRVKVTIEGDTVDIDFSGTDPQVAGNINCPFASTVSASISCAKSVLTPADIPLNEGLKRPFTVKAEYGSILNPREPAAVRARMTAANRAYSAVMKALAKAAPDKVISSGFDTCTIMCFSHQDGQRFGIYLEPLGGGFGASSTGDGCDAVDCPLSNCSNTPTESLDANYDFFRLRSYRLEPGSFGQGQYRGGAGFSRRYEVLKDDVTFAIYSDRFRLPSAGLLGGKPGSLGHCRVFRDNEVIELPPKTAFAMRKGDQLEIYLGGGAGYGDPLLRDKSLLEQDRLNGLESP